MIRPVHTVSAAGRGSIAEGIMSSKRPQETNDLPLSQRPKMMRWQPELTEEQPRGCEAPTRHLGSLMDLFKRNRDAPGRAKLAAMLCRQGARMHANPVRASWVNTHWPACQSCPRDAEHALVHDCLAMYHDISSSSVNSYFWQSHCS